MEKSILPSKSAENNAQIKPRMTPKNTNLNNIPLDFQTSRAVGSESSDGDSGDGDGGGGWRGGGDGSRGSGSGRWGGGVRNGGIGTERPLSEGHPRGSVGRSSSGRRHNHTPPPSSSPSSPELSLEESKTRTCQTHSERVNVSEGYRWRDLSYNKPNTRPCHRCTIVHAEYQSWNIIPSLSVSSKMSVVRSVGRSATGILSVGPPPSGGFFLSNPAGPPSLCFPDIPEAGGSLLQVFPLYSSLCSTGHEK